MTHHATSVFNLSTNLHHKADPELIAQDDAHFAAIAETLEKTIADISERLDTERRAPAGAGQKALDRDQEIHRLSGRLRTLRRYGIDLCLGRFIRDGDPDPVYVGRLGLTDRSGRRLLVDWRSPAAEPFFAATHARTLGLSSRRRYRWTREQITDYWDEVFTDDARQGHAALDDQSAFIASLGASRSPQMRDVLSTIQSDQDAIIRASSRGTLVVDGGPGTGKTVVALHRAAYLLYSDPRLGHHRGGVLFVGPHEPYLAYVADVLPGLGEEGVQTCTLRDLVAGGSTVGPEPDRNVARLKSSAGLVRGIETGIRFYESPPSAPLTITVEDTDLTIRMRDWKAAFEAPDDATPHNEARAEIWDELTELLLDRYNGDAAPEKVRDSIRGNREVTAEIAHAWPMIEPTDLVGDLWSVPAYLKLCAPWLERDEIRALQRAKPQAWTDSDLPLLDEARRRLGDSSADRRRREHEWTLAVQRSQMDAVVDDMVAADDDKESVATMLLREDGRTSLIDESVLDEPEQDPLAGPFAHVIVDEAQELTDAQWQMLLARCPSNSFTIVGDRAQARAGFTESWDTRLERAGFDHITQASLTINYRTPSQVMEAAEPVIRAAIPDANVPTSIRSGDSPVIYGSVTDLHTTLEEWLAEHDEGTACVIGDPGFAATPRVRSLTPELAKGLEFDLVVLVDPEDFGNTEGDEVTGAVDRYVAMTRATQRLVILTRS